MLLIVLLITFFNWGGIGVAIQAHVAMSERSATPDPGASRAAREVDNMDSRAS